MTAKRRKYAVDTSVPVERSKGEITKLLRDWGCDRLGWQEDFVNGRVGLVFIWTREEQSYGARIELLLPSEKDYREDPANRNKQTGQVVEARIRNALERQGRAEFRLLLLWLKASFHAVDAGIIRPEVLFMPFFVTKGGSTISDAVLKDLPALVVGKTTIRQLTSG